MKRRRDDPSALLWGFPAGFFDRIEVRSCYEVDKKSAVLNLDLFIRHVELSASNTSVTELGEGTAEEKTKTGKGWSGTGKGWSGCEIEERWDKSTDRIGINGGESSGKAFL